MHATVTSRAQIKESCCQQDLNLQPSGLEPDALTIELWQQKKERKEKRWWTRPESNRRATVANRACYRYITGPAVKGRRRRSVSPPRIELGSRLYQSRMLTIAPWRQERRKKRWHPCGESNPGLPGENRASLPLDDMGGSVPTGIEPARAQRPTRFPSAHPEPIGDNGTRREGKRMK